jgi:uncharacterized protein (DUF952 family)
MKIYHIISKKKWQETQDQGEYAPESLENEGFIHASKKEQVVPTANRRYQDKENLLLLVIRSEKVKPEIIFEYSSGAGEDHPHIYGPLNLDAVEEVISLKKNRSGKFYL